MEGVVDGGEGGPAHQAEAQHGQHGREHDEQGHVARDGVVLQLEDVPTYAGDEKSNRWFFLVLSDFRTEASQPGQYE